MLSAPIVTAPPTAQLVSMPEARTYLRIEQGELDTELEGYIASATADIENMTSTRLAPQTVELLADSFADLAHLSVGPVQSVVSIAYRAVDGTTVYLLEEVYELFGAGLDRGVRPQAGRSWPALRPVSGAIAIRLAVGYPALPAHLKHALKEAIRSKFDGSPVDLFSLTINDRIWL